MIPLLTLLQTERRLSREQWIELLDGLNTCSETELFARANKLTSAHFGRKVFIRGLLEVSNYCRNNCLYCGIRAANREVIRYRMTADEIVESCIRAYKAGFRSFVLQGGEEFNGGILPIGDTLRRIKAHCSDAALTLSLGEQTPECYAMWRQAGADRYLLRHETATPILYKEYHPRMSQTHRMECLSQLMSLGYQTGSGFLTGLPHQTIADHADDLCLLQELRPHMVGIGPFIPHRQTPLADANVGSVVLTLRLIALTRLLLPDALIPATTALNTLHPDGRLLALRVGANVVMPNITPPRYRELYTLYDGKKITDDEAAETLRQICEYLRIHGFRPSLERGDYKRMSDE